MTSCAKQTDNKINVLLLTIVIELRDGNHRGAEASCNNVLFKQAPATLRKDGHSRKKSE